MLKEKIQHALGDAKSLRQSPKISGVAKMLCDNQIIILEVLGAMVETIQAMNIGQPETASKSTNPPPKNNESDGKSYLERVKDVDQLFGMESVESSNIESVGFKDGTMRVRFKNKSMYHYQGVPEETFELVKTSKSVGSALNRLVVAQFKYEQVYK